MGHQKIKPKLSNFVNILKLIVADQANVSLPIH